MKYSMKYALVAMAALVMSGSLGLAQEASVVRITQSDGTVEIRKSGTESWAPAKEGDVIERGDRLAAKAKSAALLLWSNGSMVKVYPSTEIELAGVIFDLEKKLERTILDLEKGRLFIKAQVPEHLFSEFKLRMGALDLRSQGAEYAIKYDPAKKSFTAWSLFGRLVTDLGVQRFRIDEGFRGKVSEGVEPAKDNPAVMKDKIKKSLVKVSKKLGGSLLMEEEEVGTIGGKLTLKIGGVANRRGSSPYDINFKALIKGGSGKIKSIEWDFGDGETATTKKAEHTFTQGLYVVILRVEDENGDKASAQTGISAEVECEC